MSGGSGSRRPDAGATRAAAGDTGERGDAAPAQGDGAVPGPAGAGDRGAVRPWAAVPAAALAALHGVMTDVDDTLTRDGAVEPEALDALHRLAAAGVPVVAITGRPLGWSEAIAAAWPVAAIVAENGAVALVRDPAGTPGAALLTEFAQDEPTRRANALRLRAAAERVLREVPGARLARDSAGRVTDIAVDHAEFERLTPAQIDRVAALWREDGLTATVSSIHINGWIGSHSKWTAAQWMVQRLWGRRLDGERARWLYVGDSTNDQVMFEQLPLTVGVANLMDFASRLRAWPAYLTAAARGRGFAEVADAVCAARTAGRAAPG